MEKLQFGNITLTWLKGGVTNLDGGAMFGVVPKPLWSKKYPSNDNNQIQLTTDPILVQTEGRNILIESGLGKGKFSDKQKRNYGVEAETEIDESLEKLGLSVNDIDTVIMTHLHFDHASGLTKLENNQLQSVFPNAKIMTTSTEWNEMRKPNIRSQNTYWKENWEPIQEQVITFEDEIVITDSIKMVHTGGHSDGHAIIIMEQNGEVLIHMGDIMATHAHANALWVMAYDDYPMNSVYQKQTWMEYGLKRDAIYTFYHDALYRAVKFDSDGKEIVYSIKRSNK
ncbi:YtnP family quorum-quenching lactonase [Bacillus massiliigorillae]|uniref:YtnP family quorum-quenching lactonase n=1 Tax=Bacillus massiliigorillae TaxID=1243664 RepID=UPI00039D634C|nr:MBL fold metallo-hydrolase [Bacillus massiliigorillae]